MGKRKVRYVAAENESGLEGSLYLLNWGVQRKGDNYWVCGDMFKAEAEALAAHLTETQWECPRR